MFGINLVKIRSAFYVLELAMDIQNFYLTSSFEYKVTQNGYLHQNLKSIFLHDHYNLSLLSNMC